MIIQKFDDLYPFNLVRRAIKKFKILNKFSAAKYLDRSSIGMNLTRRDVAAGNHWDVMLNEILNEINATPMSFLRSPVISRTVHPDQQVLGKLYFEELLENDFFNDRILPRLQDPPMGDPYICDFFPFASPLSIQHIYYLNLILKKLGFFLPESQIGQIVEVGGGYGNFARLLRNYGYEGCHTILDLPEMQVMQQHYLAHVLPEKQRRTIEYKIIGDDNIVDKTSPSLLIATFSISEMPMATRLALESYYNTFNYLFFAYNTSFDGIDNREYFADLQKRLEINFEISFFKDDHRTAWFLICKRK